VDEYNSRFVAGEEEQPVYTRRAPSTARRRRANERHESRLVAIAVAAIVILTALVIAAWKFGGPESPKVPGLASGQVAGTSTQRAKGTARLVVRASTGSSWMEVRQTSSAGKLLYSGTLERGQRKSFEGKSLQLALAEPQNVLVRLNGNRVDLPNGSTFVVTSQRILRTTS
jgi:hypothetical protein